MEDLTLIARQLQREISQGEEARGRLTSRTQRAQDNAYASSTVYGQKLLKTNLDLVAQRMAERLKYLRRGSAAVDAATVFKHLKEADPNVLALITMKVALDTLGKTPKPEMVQLCSAIGRAIQIELRLNFYKQQNPKLFKEVEKRFHNATGTRQKATVFRKKVQRWRHQLGQLDHLSGSQGRQLVPRWSDGRHRLDHQPSPPARNQEGLLCSLLPRVSRDA